MGCITRIITREEGKCILDQCNSLQAHVPSCPSVSTTSCVARQGCFKTISSLERDSDLVVGRERSRVCMFVGQYCRQAGEASLGVGLAGRQRRIAYGMELCKSRI